MITKEQIKKDVLEYMESNFGILEQPQVESQILEHGVNDLDLVEMEVFLEEKYKFMPSDGNIAGADTNDNNTVDEIVNLLYSYFNRNEK